MSRYVLDFGSANAGASPTFTVFKRTDTLVSATAPTITAIGGGLYYFDYDSAGGQIVYKSIVAGTERWGLCGYTSQNPGRYWLDFGLANAGGAPTFTGYTWQNFDTGLVLTAPSINELGSGLYYFDYTAPTGVNQILYKITFGGIELSDVLTVISSGGEWDIAGNIINDAAVELGLPASSDPFNSTDSNHQQLCRLLKSAGRELIHAREWSYLRKEATFTTSAGIASYPLPADFHQMIDQSGWNRTNRLPLGGPLSAQEWQYLKARLVGVVFTVLFRPMNRVIEIYPDTNTPAGYSIAYEYISSWWVQAPGNSTTSGDQPTSSDDIIWFDPLLVVRKLKLDWLKIKGFDTTSALSDYLYTLEQVKGADAPSPVLSLTRNTMVPRDPLIGSQSVPVTGFGV